MVNGLQVGLGQAAPATIGTWSLRSQTFTAPANGICVIALQGVITAGSGNDFGLDDISFTGNQSECKGLAFLNTNTSV